MSYLAATAGPDRRCESRVRLELFLNQYVKEQTYRSLAINLSHTGLFLQKLTEPVVRPARLVGLEFELPGTSEVIWASAESCFDSIGRDFHLTGLRFVAMARKHERLLHDFIFEKKRREMRWFCIPRPKTAYRSIPLPSPSPSIDL